MRLAATGTVGILAIAMFAASAASPPGVIHYQGVLRDDADQPAETGNYAMVFRFFDAESGGEAILVDTQAGVHVAGGLFGVTLGLASNVSDGPGPGSYSSLVQVFGDHPSLYLEVQVNGETLAPRMPIASTGFALNSTLVRGVDITTDGPLQLYVDDSGNDANDGLSPEKPKRTIQAGIDAIPVLLTGEVVVNVGSGTYNERVMMFPRVRSGGVHWIRLRGNTAFPQTVVLDGTGLDPVGEDRPEAGLFVYDVPVEVSGLTIQNFANRAVSAEFSSYLLMRDCRIVNNLTPHEAAVGAFQGAAIELRGCEIRGNCVGVGAANGGSVDVRNFVVIQDNGASPVCDDQNDKAVEARNNGRVSFEVDQDGNCRVENNDMYASDQSTVSNWNRCVLVNSTCIAEANDPTARCRPEP